MGNQPTGHALGSGAADAKSTLLEVEVHNELGQALQLTRNEDWGRRRPGFMSMVPPTIGSSRATIQLHGPSLVGGAVYSCGVALGQSPVQTAVSESNAALKTRMTDYRSSAEMRQYFAVAVVESSDSAVGEQLCFGAAFGSFWEGAEEALREAEANATAGESGEGGVCAWSRAAQTSTGAPGARYTLRVGAQRRRPAGPRSAGGGGASDGASAAPEAAGAPAAAAASRGRPAHGARAAQGGAAEASPEAPAAAAAAAVDEAHPPLTPIGDIRAAAAAAAASPRPHGRGAAPLPEAGAAGPARAAAPGEARRAAAGTAAPAVAAPAPARPPLTPIGDIAAAAAAAAAGRARPPEGGGAAPALPEAAAAAEAPAAAREEVRRTASRTGALAVEAAAAAEEAARRRVAEAERQRLAAEEAERARREVEEAEREARRQEVLLRESQDQEFQQSLLMDRTKDLVAREGALRSEAELLASRVDGAGRDLRNAEQRLERFGGNPRLEEEASRAAEELAAAQARSAEVAEELAGVSAEIANNNEIIGTLLAVD